MQPDLQITAARFVLGVLVPEVLVRIANELLKEGIYTPAARELGMLTSEQHPSVQVVMPLFEQMLSELGMSLPSTEEATWILARYYIEGIVSGRVPPQEGLRLLHEDVYVAGNLHERSHEYAGDSYGIQDLYSMYWAYEEIKGRPDELSFHGFYGDAALEAMDREVIRLARQWITDHGLSKGP